MICGRGPGDIEAGKMFAVLIPNFTDSSITSPYAIIFAEIIIIVSRKKKKKTVSHESEQVSSLNSSSSIQVLVILLGRWVLVI